MEDLPIPQLAQELAPVVRAYFPTGHDRHEAAPVIGWHLPAAHAVQIDAPRSEYVPTEHDEHADEETALSDAKNLPMAHGTQAKVPDDD
jgi:hypothetical protein